MAYEVVYVDDGGSDTDPYETWAKAANALETVDSLVPAGGTVYIASDHVEQKNVASFVFAFANGTIANPVKVISADQSSGEPPTTYETMHSQGGIFEAQGAADDITITGGVVMYGIKLDSGDKFTIGTGKNLEKFVDCYFMGVDDFALVTGNEPVIEFIGCSFDLSDVCFLYPDKTVLFRECTFVAASAAGIFQNADGLTLLVEDTDLSVEPTLCSNASMAGDNTSLILRRCELAASWEPPTIFDHPNTFFLVESCIAGTDIDPIIGMQYYADMYGVIEAEMTLIRTGGASDGTTSYSWKMVSSANTIERHTCLRSPPIVAWLENDETTIKIYIYHDAAGGGGAGDLTDIECWVEVSSPNETANPNTTSQGAYQTTLPAVLAAATDIPNDGVSAWGGALATKQVITVTVGPAEDGPVVVRVCLGKASTTMYVDPKLDIS